MHYAQQVAVRRTVDIREPEPRMVHVRVPAIQIKHTIATLMPNLGLKRVVRRPDKLVNPITPVLRVIEEP